MKQTNIKKNIVMNVILTSSNFLFPLITFPYISRILLPEGTGKVSFATSFISYFTMLTSLGIPTYGIRACAKVRDNREELTRTAHELLSVNLAMSIVSYLLLALLLLFVPRLQEERTLYLIVSVSIFLNAIGMEWLYKALEQYTYITVRSIIFKAVAMIAMFALVHSKADYVIYGGISIFATGASNVLNFLNARKYIQMRPVGKYNVRRHLKPIGVFFGVSCAATIYQNLDTSMLGFMKTDVDVGLYQAAIKISMILSSVLISVSTVLLPRCSYYIEHNMRREFESAVKKGFHLVLLLGVPMTVYFILFARPGIMFLSGEAYEGAILPMQIIMPVVLLTGLSNVTGSQILIPLNKEKDVLYSEIAGILGDAALNWFLITHYRSAGAAVATLAAKIIVFWWQFRIAKRELPAGALRGMHAPAILGSSVAGGLAAVAVSEILPVSNAFVVLVCTFAVFASIYLGLLLLLKEDMTLEICRDVRKKVLKR